jgi:hypothetical protein
MKKYFIFILLFSLIQSNSYSQFYLKGKVTTISNEILEGASVYLNGTTIGTTTNSKGEFELKSKEGNYDLVVSFIGYQTAQIHIDTKNKTAFLNFKLKVGSNVLNEIVLKKTIYDADWKYNLSRFKKSFLGRTLLAKDCEILNPKVLHFEFYPKTGTLTAEAKEPLKIKHKGLGYLITYDLVSFSIERKTLSYLGYTKYDNLKGEKRKQRRWRKNRLKAFNGSRMHFGRSLHSQNLKEEGFVVNQFRRALNPERPTEKEIKMARQLLRLYGKHLDFRKKTSDPKTALDSARIVLSKVSLPKHIDYLYKTKVPYSDIIHPKEGQVFINFENYLSVTYLKETEEANYLIGMFGKRKKASGVQTSAITLLTKTAILDPSGDIINPLDVFSEGYWGYEQFADLIPLDYQPIKG